MNKSNVVISSVAGALLLAVGALLYQHHSDSGRISELERELVELKKKEKQSAVDRSVSHQMEEIAYGQQMLSEERSREAIRQSEIAQAATKRSEAERSRALQAQSQAEMSAQDALEAFQIAERQRQEADNRRKEAVYARQVADTLNYISLGRTLGTQSFAIYQAGDRETGNMLAYAAYMYTRDYGGDLYAPAVFQALAQSAGGRRDWNIHRGSISRLNVLPEAESIVTVSNYGELFTHKKKDNQVTTQRLMRDHDYCFRDVYVTKDAKIFAVSLNGQLVIADQGKTHILPLTGVDRPFSILGMKEGRQLLIIGEKSMAMFDIAAEKITGTRQLNYRVVSTSSRDSKPLLFDDRGRMHLVSSLNDMTNERVPVAGTVTAYASSKSEHLDAYGMSDGTIWLTSNNGKSSKLVGHLSQVTRMRFNGRRLYSSSYDGKLLFWVLTSGQIKPITLFQSNNWLMDFTFDKSEEHIWSAQSDGTITENLISLPLIGQRIKQSLKRNFTQEEWDYYVGKGIPYRKFISNKK